MPRMPARLSIIQPSKAPQCQPLRSSHLSVPPSPTSPKAPLHPPDRLHLRPIIPSPPLSPAFLATAPDSPYPWIWRCHICHSVYSLGVTRRCLEDGHLFCSNPNQNIASTPPNTLSEGQSPSLEELAEKSKEGRRKRKRRPRKACRAEFDYTGWNKYNIWRREVHIIQVEKQGISPTDENPYLPNCWMECDFPSECHNTRLERLREVRKVVELSRDQPHFNSQEWEAQQEAAEVEVQIENMLDDSPPIDLLSSPSTPEEEALETERRGLEGEADLVDLNIANLEGSDIEDEMGLKEVEFVQKRRKKSIQKIRQLTGLSLGAEAMDIDTTPPSPLKMQFGPEDMEEVDLGETNKIDPQMQELLQTRSDYLRSLTTIGENEERFGDEAVIMF